MGLFGPSQPEKIRRSAAQTFPNADWKMEVDWSTGSKVHKLQGTTADSHTEEEAMQFAHDVWDAMTKQYRLSPDDGFDGLLDVCVSSAGCQEQRTGTDG